MDKINNTNKDTTHDIVNTVEQQKQSEIEKWDEKRKKFIEQYFSRRPMELRTIAFILALIAGILCGMLEIWHDPVAKNCTIVGRIVTTILFGGLVGFLYCQILLGISLAFQTFILFVTSKTVNKRFVIIFISMFTCIFFCAIIGYHCGRFVHYYVSSETTEVCRVVGIMIGMIMGIMIGIIIGWRLDRMICNRP